MKRTELKRGASQMKRTPMKKREKRHRDTKESLTIRATYRRENPCCEVAKFFLRHTELAVKFGYGKCARWKDGPVECDHLWGGTAGRIDLVSMLIVVAPEWHAWKTVNFMQGLLLFLVVKFAKGEINADEFRQCSGMNLVGWIVNHRAEWPVCLVPYLDELVKSLEEE